MMCRDCKTDLPDESFAWRKKDLLRHKICRACQKVRQRTWYEANRAQHIANASAISTAARQRQRELLASIKARPCVDCDRQYPPHVMQFDHLGDKHFTISKMIGVYSDARLLAEVAKCEVVCANCHCERTHWRRSSSGSSTVERLPVEQEEAGSTPV